MKVTYSWLRDFVEIKISAKALAEKFTTAGLEVVSLGAKEGDFIFEIEVTSNRPDCLSVIGLAREAAAITGKKLRLPRMANRKMQTKKLKSLTYDPRLFSIKIENRQDCPLYTAKIIKDVKVGPSADWLKKRLELLGARSVNNIVDITNYILFEWGQPLHAFDLDKIINQQEIIIRRANKEEEILTIDGIKRTLDNQILVIASGRGGPIAIAGVMGGEDTEVTQGTRNILLEAAVFNPVVVRRARQLFGVQSDSAYRFERGVDLGKVKFASLKAEQMIQESCGGTCVLTKSLGLVKEKREVIGLDVSVASNVLGLKTANLKIKSILNRLGCQVKPKTKNKLSVFIPSYRPDLKSEIDLIEEIARICGYEQIPKSVPRFSPQITTCNRRELVSRIKNLLAGMGLNEVVTYSLINKDFLRGLALSDNCIVSVENPLSKEQEILRPTLISGLAQCIAYNLNQKQDYVNIFEIAKVFQGQPHLPKEELALGIAMCGARPRLAFGSDTINEPAGPLHIKGALEVIFERLNIKDYNFVFAEDNRKIVIYVSAEQVGVITALSKETVECLDIKKEVWTAEVILDKLLPKVSLNKHFIPLPVYPGISRDISMVAKEEIRAGDVLETLKQKAGPLLKEIKIIDYYKGEQIPAGFQGLTVSCLYRSQERTLTDAEVDFLHSLISGALKEKFGLQIR